MHVTQPTPNEPRDPSVRSSTPLLVALEHPPRRVPPGHDQIIRRRSQRRVHVPQAVVHLENEEHLSWDHVEHGDDFPQVSLRVPADHGPVPAAVPGRRGVEGSRPRPLHDLVEGPRGQHGRQEGVHFAHAQPSARRFDLADVRHHDPPPQARVGLLEIPIQGLVQAVIDEDHLGLALLGRVLPQQDIRLVRIAVDESVVEYL
mmetsp:Transcript_11245/g.24345  ORF Transcript_11245/g.24345 Transcript_11245/m.24345 type:complete len:202 (-) Transcript_11245:286-891(-)